MQDQKPSPPASENKSVFFIGGLIVLLVVLVLTAAAGWAIGRASQAPETQIVTTIETITEVREVTREIEIVITPTPAASPTSVEKIVPLDSPAAVQTVIPAGENLPSLNGEFDLEGDDFDFSTFNETWEFIEREFDGQLPEDKMRLYAAIAGSLESLNDEYTRFIRPDVAQRMREDLDGSVSGIGAFVRENADGLIEITRPIDGQPADLAGLLSGDVIIAVDGESVIDFSFDEVLLLVRGPEGSAVTLTVTRADEEEPLDVTIVRAVFEVPVVVSEMYNVDDQRVGYLRLSSFTRNAEPSVQDALETLLAEDPVGLIFDLRDNGGGFLDQAVSVADVFLPEGVVLFERDSNGEIDKTFESDGGDVGENIPLVVLVNSGSASASEIVAGAIQDRDRGVLIGETTFGKGSVQIIHTLSDGSELRVTIARWYTPNNQSISQNGIDPDIEVPTPLDLGGEEDDQIQRALDYLINGELSG
ncbi:MAG: S41 family peptidase [Candidatus Promineifilaceae bacterium]|nr:S41 family peptidase [Candidatus Promineifilaceae bacterium]